VNANYNSHNDRDTPVCRKCQHAIAIQGENDVLDKFGDFVRLRCTIPDCRHVDWYKAPIFTPASDAVQSSPEDPGEVWVHDVILGLSFRAESNTTH
jgi:hypothetical protein